MGKNSKRSSKNLFKRFKEIYVTWSKSWKSEALGWWIVHTMVRPCRASSFNNWTTCVQEELSSPLGDEMKLVKFTYKSNIGFMNCQRDAIE